MTLIDQIEKEQLRNDIAPFNIGDTVKVSVKVKEGDKERIQAGEDETLLSEECLNEINNIHPVEFR